MPERRSLRMLLFIAAAAILVFSVKFGFADAWVAQYSLPAAELSAEYASAPISTAPLKADPAPDTLQAPKPAVLSNRVTEYHINVALNEKDGTLSGQQTVTWKNPGRKPVSDLYFHLYPNAFAPGSTFLKESGGQLRGDKMNPDSNGSMEITALTTDEGETLLPRVRYIQPDDGNKNDRTLMT
ncbi:MAG: M1 family peptidase, partial [Cohnella sp.]|nr:M1 family peptidase [Cohnella sp.]